LRDGEESKIMVQRYTVKVAAYLEIVVGAIFITAPNIPCALLFGADTDNIGTALARWVGVSLFALGVACLPSKAGQSNHSAAFGLFVFNAGVTILFAWVGVVVQVHGVLLWPAVILHAVIAGALLSHLQSKGSVE